MGFAIIEIKDSNRVVISTTDTITKFKSELEQKYPVAKLHQDITLKDLKYGDIFKTGFYLIHNDLTFFYVEKLVEVKSGYIYNSSKVVVKVLCQWDLIPCDTYKNDYDDTIELFAHMAPQKNPFTDLPIIEVPKKLDLSTINPYSNINIIGKRCTGKTMIIQNILDQKDPEFIRNSLIISMTDRITGAYKERYPEATVIFKYDEDILSEFMVNHSTHDSAIIVDDCFSSNYKYDDTFTELLFNNQEYRKMVITTMLCPLVVKPEIRSKYDYVFMLSEDFESNQKRLYAQYGDIFPTFDEFRNCFINVSDNDYYNSLVILQNRAYTKNLDIYDNVFTFKAQID